MGARGCFNEAPLETERAITAGEAKGERSANTMKRLQR